jgi:hypothetical protein
MHLEALGTGDLKPRYVCHWTLSADNSSENQSLRLFTGAENGTLVWKTVALWCYAAKLRG